ncbi:MAG: DNA polymerase III subunit beta [Solirubrobacteraceae bacterium]
MKLHTPAQDLLGHLQSLSRIASGRLANPTLSGVQIAATADRIELRATDLQIGLRIAIEGEVEQPGTVVLPARLLLDIARQAPGPRISLELRQDEQDVEVTAGSAVFQLRTLRAEDFPPLPEPADATAVEVPAAAFVATTTKVVRSAARDDTRPLLACVLVRAEGDGLTMVATDSYRLSEKRTTLETPLEGGFEANVPARVMQELERLVPATGAETLSVARGENQVLFTVGDHVLSSRLVDGTFPQYRSLIPETFDHELRISTSELREVVGRVSLLAQKAAALRLAFSEGELTVSSQTQDVGEAKESLPVPFHGEPLDIGFNPEYLRDGLASIESDEVLLRLTSPIRPGLLQTADDQGFLYLIMPIRLNN